MKRILAAVGSAFLFQALDLGAKNLATRNGAAIPLIYLIDLLPFGLGFGILLFGGTRLGPFLPSVWRFAPAVR